MLAHVAMPHIADIVVLSGPIVRFNVFFASWTIAATRVTVTVPTSRVLVKTGERAL
jgi:hypothetical protein